MTLIKEYSDGIKCLQLEEFTDIRGSFIKTCKRSDMASLGINTDFKESYFSVSKKDVIRGMHFQNPPHHHEKLVFVIKGHVTDVVLDLRKFSPRYGKFRSFELSDSNRQALFIPKGFAHGFVSREENTVMYYFVETEHAPSHDAGIAWDSFGCSWDVETPIISQRDQDHVTLAKFESQFE